MGQYDPETGDTADRGVARHQKKVDCDGRDRISQGHDKHFFDKPLVVHDNKSFPAETFALPCTASGRMSCLKIRCCPRETIILPHQYILDGHGMQENVVKCE